MEIKNNKMSEESVSDNMSEKQHINFIQPQKAITFLFALSMVYGNIIGTGIFISVKPTLEVFESNSIGMAVIFWLLGGVISIFGGLCYAELATRIPKSGGERAYFREVLGEKFSKTFVITFAFILKPLTIAAVSIIVAKYTVAIFTEDESLKWLEKLLGFVFILACLIINCASKVVANKIGVVLTLLKTIALLIIIGSGMYYLCKGHTEDWKNPFVLEGISIPNLGICLVNLFWACEGWNTLGLIAGDMRNPQKDLPRAIIIGLSGVIILYTLAVVSYCAVLGYQTVREIETVALTLGKHVFAAGYWVIALLICCSGLGALNGNFYAVSCICVSAGQSGDIPKVFSLVHRRQRTGIFSSFILFFISSLFLPLPFQTILGYCAFISWVFYFVSMVCLWILKISTRKENIPRVFSIPYPLIVIVQITCLLVVGLCFYNAPLGTGIICLVLLLIFALQFVPPKYTSFRALKNFHNSLINWLCWKFYLDEARESDVS